MTDYHEIGTEYPDLDRERLVTEKARMTYDVCLQHADFTLKELRKLKLVDSSVADVIVVTCCNDQVPSRNSVGIKVREDLALVFYEGSVRSPEVRVVRTNFPVIPHLNDVPTGEPAWLCIYFESWNSVQRDWTPQKFLQRILWWLSEAAKESLHRSDQPVERIYFDSPYEVVLPPEFEDKINDPATVFVMQGIPIDSDGVFRVARGEFVDRTLVVPEGEFRKLCPIILTIDSIVHGIREKHPKTLGELNDQIVNRGAEFFTKLRSALMERVDSAGVQASFGNVLLIVRFPIKRDEGAEVEEYEIRAFGVDEEFTKLGVSTGSLFKNSADAKFYRDCLIGDFTEIEASNAWRENTLIPITIKKATTHSFAQTASGVNSDTADFSGVIGGVGALGSVLVDTWCKEAWGKWSLVDDDILRSHNVLRHIGKDGFVGYYKTDVVAKLSADNYSPGYEQIRSFHGLIADETDERLKEVVSSADLLVDASTTLDAPRDLAQSDYVPRSVSVFLTPSGRDSVLLFEDAGQIAKLDCLEAQYYRGIINSDWGKEHLQGHLGEIAIGAGCRDISVVMSFESIQLHAAILAKQIRLLRDQSAACVRVWTEHSSNGSVRCVDISVSDVIQESHGNWRVITDEALHEKLRQMRLDGLPSETGGVIVGYVDQVLQSISVVDVLPAPIDSECSRSGFVRGTEGLVDKLEEISNRTAKIVQYIGEWHSHPPFASVRPSFLDHILLQHLADNLATDGLPALMMIVGTDGDVGITVKMS